MKRGYSILFFILSYTILCAQDKKVDKSEFRKLVSDGGYLLLEGNNVEALRNFKQAYKIDSSTANINFRLGYCYLKSAAEKNKAAYHLEKAVQNISENYDEFNAKEEKAPVFSYYYLAQAYHLNYRFDDAIAYYDKFLFEIGNRNKELVAEVVRQREISLNGAELIRKPVDIELMSLGNVINTSFPEYGPVITADESTIIFTSRREGTSGDGKDFDGMYFEDIYISYKNKEGIWTKPVSIGPTINTPGHEASIGLSPDGQQLLIYRDDGGDGNIYISKLEGDVWSVPEKMGSDINTKGWEPSASISADGNAIYFVSDRKGGFGGRDIWRCIKLPDGKWSLALNLGSMINTSYDEDGPFMHPDGVTLFFSSKGHKTMGGYDIFYSKLSEEKNTWGIPQNIGYPINTTDDDVFYVTSPDGKRSYYSSDKAGGMGEKDIYMINNREAVVDPVFILKGYITINDSARMHSGVRIIVTDMESGKVVQEYRPNSKTGKYLMALSPGQNGKTYHVSYEADSFDPIQDTIVVTKYNLVEKEVDLRPVNFGSSKLGIITISGVIKNKNGKPIPQSKVVVRDNQSGVLVGIYHANHETGEYNFALKKGKNYNLSYEAQGHLFQSDNLNLDKADPKKVISKDIMMEELKTGASMVLNNIFFDYNKASLRSASKVELAKLLKFLKNNPSLRIEIAGHTDSKGKDLFNQNLSEARAQSVVDYLVSKGVEKGRLEVKGYGETVPLAKETLPNGKPDQKGMQKNRRVELKIIE